MTLLATIGIALGALKANKMRSLLTMLGVIIGVSSVVTMVAVSDGASANVEKVINSLGTDTLMVFPSSSNSRGRMGGAGSAKKFVDGDVEAIREEVEGVIAISGHVRGGAVIVGGGKNWPTNLEGVEPSHFEIKQWQVSAVAFLLSKKTVALANLLLLVKLLQLSCLVMLSLRLVSVFALVTCLCLLSVFWLKKVKPLGVRIKTMLFLHRLILRGNAFSVVALALTKCG